MCSYIHRPMSSMHIMYKLVSLDLSGALDLLTCSGRLAVCNASSAYDWPCSSMPGGSRDGPSSLGSATCHNIRGTYWRSLGLSVPNGVIIQVSTSLVYPLGAEAMSGLGLARHFASMARVSPSIAPKIGGSYICGLKRFLHPFGHALHGHRRRHIDADLHNMASPKLSGSQSHAHALCGPNVCTPLCRRSCFPKQVIVERA